MIPNGWGKKKKVETGWRREKEEEAGWRCGQVELAAGHWIRSSELLKYSDMVP